MQHWWWQWRPRPRPRPRPRSNISDPGPGSENICDPGPGLENICDPGPGQIPTLVGHYTQTLIFQTAPSSDYQLLFTFVDSFWQKNVNFEQLFFIFIMSFPIKIIYQCILCDIYYRNRCLTLKWCGPLLYPYWCLFFSISRADLLPRFIKNSFKMWSKK